MLPVRVFCAALVFAALGACSSSTRLSVPSAAPAVSQKGCVVDIYADKNQKPDRAYRELSKAESRIRRNIFFGGKATLEDDAYAELRLQACKIGADAVIIEDYIVSSAAELSHVYVWAVLVRYTDQ